MKPLRLFLALLLISGLTFAAHANDGNRHDDSDEANDIELTWMSIANWYFKIGDLRIIMDGYITRVPGPPFFVASPQFPADQFAFTIGPRTVEVGSIKRVLEALPARGRLDLLLTGHSHFDHSWDTWARSMFAHLNDPWRAYFLFADRSDPSRIGQARIAALVH